MECCSQGQKGIQSRGLVKGEEGEFLIPIKEEGSTVTSLLM